MHMRKISDFTALLQSSHLRETQPRKLVLQALARATSPVTPYAIKRSLEAKDTALNVVTIYRILDAFESARIVHRHPRDGSFSLCALPKRGGHHGFLHCNECGAVTEFANDSLCAIEHGIARKAGFAPVDHISEIVGRCRSCR